MSLDALYARDIEANYRRKVATPAPLPETSFSLWSSLGAGLSGVPGGLLEVTGSGVDILSHAQRQVQRRQRPVVLRDQPAPRFDNVDGGIFRSKAAEFAPDPQTAHWADQALYGIVRFGTKAAAAVVAAGPAAGATLLAAEETNTQTKGLIEKGVDPDTALLTGMTLGVAGAVGAALPISGAAMSNTLKGQIAATAGLVAVGGPGLYMAQEATARQLLGAAGYDAEAATHDPTDALGLALSTILPGGFGAWSVRNAARQARLAKMAAPKTEAQLKEAAALTPEEQAASDAFERSDANLAQLREAIKAEKNPENRAVLEQELATQEAAARAAAREPAQPADPETLDAARALQVERALSNNLPDMPNARGMVLGAMDEVAAGRFPDVPAPDPEAVATLRLIDDQIEQLETELAATLPATSGLAERGAIRQAREELRLMEQTRPDASEAATRALAKEIQARERVSYKAALSDAKKIIADQVAAWQGRQQRLQGFIADNAEAQRQTQRAGEIEKQLEVLRSRRAEAASAVEQAQQVSARAEPDNAIPRTEDAAEPAPVDAAPAEPAAPRGKPRDLKAELIAARKSESLLKSLLECLG